MLLVSVEELKKKAVPHVRGTYGYSAKLEDWAVLISDINATPAIDSKDIISRQWISVKDKLPSIGEEVLAYVPLDGQIFVGHCIKPYWRKDQYVWQITTAMKQTKTMTKKVSHWMPLPERPKEENASNNAK